MVRNPYFIGVLAAAMLLGVIGPAHAAWISEVSFASRFARDNGLGGATLPRYIEISGIPASTPLELVVIDASSPVSQYGNVLRVLTIPVGQPVQLIAETAWPIGVLPGNPAPAGVVTTLASGTFQFTAIDKRTMLLYDHATGLTPGLLLRNQTINPGTTLLDLLTWGAGAKKFNAGDTVYDFSAATAAARPNQNIAAPGSAFLSGTPNIDQYFPNIAPAFQLNPGQFNFVWAVPEPASGVLLLAMAIIGLQLHGRRQ